MQKNFGQWKYHDRPRPGVLHHVAKSGDQIERFAQALNAKWTCTPFANSVILLINLATALFVLPFAATSNFYWATKANAPLN